MVSVTVLAVAALPALWWSRSFAVLYAPVGQRLVNVATFTQVELQNYTGQAGGEIRFTVQVNRTQGGPRLGMKFGDDGSGDAMSLKVEEVYPEGLIAQWNMHNPNKRVMPGDSLLMVNGAHEAESIAQECSQHRPLDVSLARKHDGSVLLAVLGRVFNVTTGLEFYGPKETYRVFAGRECSYNMAITSTKKKSIAKSLEDTTEKQLEHLNETYWLTYVDKYPIVGVLSDSPFDPADFDRFAGSWADAQKPQLEVPDVLFKNVTKRESRCPVTRAAKTIGNTLAQFVPRLLLGGPADS